MHNVRLYFSKTFDARYISHLDLARCFSRAIKMSGVPVWYTEGFNEHIYMTFALPLPLGVESICEIVDIRVVGDLPDNNIPAMLNDHLPYGIEVFDMRPPVHKVSKIAYARYIVELGDETLPAEEIEQAARRLLEQTELLTHKKTKKGILQELDIRPLLEEATVKTSGDTCYLNLITAAGSERSLNPALLLDMLFGQLPKQPDHILVKRIQILDADKNNFE